MLTRFLAQSHCFMRPAVPLFCNFANVIQMYASGPSGETSHLAGCQPWPPLKASVAGEPHFAVGQPDRLDKDARI